MMIVDAHLDIAYNALNHGRSPLHPISYTRAQEEPDGERGQATVSFPDMRQGGVGLVFGTLFVTPSHAKIPTLADKMVYHNANEAFGYGMKQLDFYHRLVDENQSLRLVTHQAALDEVLASHQDDNPAPLLGIVPLMEGADPIREPEEAEMWYERGLRLIGLAWDDTRYATGGWTRTDDGLTKEGYRLLEVMADLGFILDLTHMSEKSTIEALERYEGVTVATHSNCRALVPGTRQLSDTQIRLIGERDGVIGTVLYNAFLQPGWRKGDRKAAVTLDHVVANIDHVCQVLGSARSVGIGSDLDGGFGAEHIPAELDSIADLGKIGDALLARGYETSDVAGIMSGNWLRILRRALP
ncbi:MAG: membrane dipeptidase [Chloroflexi bacterium]|nr:membrane dipeptidase [Chloroflexota bacterium]